MSTNSRDKMGTESEKKALLSASTSVVQEDGLHSPPAGEAFGKRHLLAVLAFLGFFNVYCLRVNLSVALVAMVNNTKKVTNHSMDACPSIHGTDNSTTKQGDLDWDESTQGIVLGSFFYGYIVTQLPGGWLAEVFGAKKLFGFGVLCTAALTLLTPVVVNDLGLGSFIALRVIEGLGEGVTFPAMSAMWGKWAPLWERSKLAGFTYAGAQLGTVVSMPISGILCDSDFLGGWPSVFYIFGVLGCLWFVVWMLMVHDTPAKHPTISAEERTYIETSIGLKQRLRTPWKAILTSKAVWGICAGHFANNWGFYTMLTSLPTYMKQILNFDISENGFISALPYVVCCICQTSSGHIADFIRKNGYLSTRNTRKLFMTLGLMLPAILMFCIGYAGCNHVVVVTMLTFAVGLGGICMGGFNVNHLDIAPNFSGTLMGISNCLATIPGFLGPYIVGRLTNNNQTRAQWQIVFYICSAVYLAGTILYLLLAEGSEQPWNQQGGEVLTFSSPSSKEPRHEEQPTNLQYNTLQTEK